MANLKNITDLPIIESADGVNLIVNDNGSAKQIAASAVGAQADFNVTDENHPAFIKNKPVAVKPDWNQNDETAADYVKNRPFFDTRKFEQVTLTFDGDMTGKETMPANEGLYLVKLSDEIPSKEELIGGSMSVYREGNINTFKIINNDIQDNGDGFLQVYDALFVIVPTDNYTFYGATIPYKGTWTVCVVQENTPVVYLSKLSWAKLVSGSLKKIEDKYLPDNKLAERFEGIIDRLGFNIDDVWNSIWSSEPESEYHTSVPLNREVFEQVQTQCLYSPIVIFDGINVFTTWLDGSNVICIGGHFFSMGYSDHLEFHNINCEIYIDEEDTSQLNIFIGKSVKKLAYVTE